MTEDEDFLGLVEKSFPEKPIPTHFFWWECEGLLDHDIPQELSRRIAYRSWKHVKILDWRMIGTSPAIARFYMEPATFLYYLPSLLIGTFQNVEHIDFALESMAPYNKKRVPRGKWWVEFSGVISPSQCATLSVFLSRVRLVLWDKIGLTNQSLVQDAERIWSDTNRPFG